MGARWFVTLEATLERGQEKSSLGCRKRKRGREGRATCSFQPLFEVFHCSDFLVVIGTLGGFVGHEEGAEYSAEGDFLVVAYATNFFR